MSKFKHMSKEEFSKFCKENRKYTFYNYLAEVTNLDGTKEPIEVWDSSSHGLSLGPSKKACYVAALLYSTDEITNTEEKMRFNELSEDELKAACTKYDIEVVFEERLV